MSQLRVVFTSFSQELCKEQKKSFVQMVKNVSSITYKEMDDNDINFTSNNNCLAFNEIGDNEMKKISSFRDVNSYPIFINFRKIMFMIDGSLTFQFFKRKDLKIFENADDSMFYYDEEIVYNSWFRRLF